MRVYEGAPRQNYEDVLRSIGAVLDQRGMREILLTETNDALIVQGLAPVVADSAWGDVPLRLEKETFTYLDDDIARFLEDAVNRRRQAEEAPAAGFYENALRVLGAYIDDQKPRDIFFLEQDHSFVLRLLMSVKGTPRHVLAEFTEEDIEAMMNRGRTFRAQPLVDPAAS